MKNLLKQLQEYWSLIVFIFGGVVAITQIVGDDYVGGVADDTLKSDATKLYIQKIIAEELEEAKAMTEMVGKLNLHDSQISGNTADIELTQTQLQDVARILMTPPE